jgi:hypothetical protein
MAGADEQKEPAETGTALSLNLARQRALAEGKRVVNTQGRDSVALADSKYATPEEDEVPGWMA